MCSSKTKVIGGGGGGSGAGSDQVTLPVTTSTITDHMNGRPVLQPNCNINTPTKTTLLYRRCHSMKKPSSATKPLLPPLQPSPPPKTTTSPTPPISPKLKSPRPPALKRSSSAKVVDDSSITSSLKYSSSMIVDSPGSIAAARREQVANMQVQRKMKIAHYGRTKSANFERLPPNTHDHDLLITTTRDHQQQVDNKRSCNFITPNSDPMYIAYHDEEWGVPVHDDRILFELLLLTGAQVGSDWTCVLKKRQDFRDAFSGFDAESVSKYTEKKINSISADYGIQLSLVRGVVDNSKRILEIKKQFGSFDKYLWGFVNHKPIATQYKSCFKIPVKTSKSETISKDMVKKGFRLVGPTVIHSFMQAAGLTNDHLLACPRHLQCVALASSQSSPTTL